MAGMLCHVPYKPQQPPPAPVATDKYVNEIQKEKKLQNSYSCLECPWKYPVEVKETKSDLKVPLDAW